MSQNAPLEQVLSALPERPTAAAAAIALAALEQARSYGLGALLAHYLPEQAALPKSEELAARFSAARLQRLTLAALSLLEQAGLKPVLLKGLAIAARCYPEPWLRPAVDVDVLVTPESLDPATRALEHAGWTRRTQAPKSSFEYSKDVAFAAPGGGLLELHFGYSADFQARVDVAAMVSRSRVVRLAGRDVRVLSDADDLLLQCVHAAHHGFEGVKWLFDLKLLAMAGPDWRALPPLAGEYRVASAVGMALREAERRVRAPVPGWLLRELPPGRVRAMAVRRVARSKDPDVASLGTSLLLADALSAGLLQEAVFRPLGRALSRAGWGEQAKKAARELAARVGALRRKDV